jgi:Ca2+-binding RTX toxin-like protein
VLFLVAFLCLLVLGLAPQASAAGSGAFSPTGSMFVPRFGAVAAPLPDGRVLVAGGAYDLQVHSVKETESAEVFNPATGTFSRAGIGSMSVPRIGAAAAPLPDGRVLVAGGNDGNQFLSSAEVFNPATNSFSSAGIGSMSVPRYHAAAAPLPDGRVLVAGGGREVGGPLGSDPSSAELFDPATNSFSSAGIGSMSRPRIGPAAPLPDGRVLLAGGFADAPGAAGAEVFDPATNSFSSAGIGSVSAPRDVAAPLPDGRVLVAGGYDGSVLSSAEVFAPVSCRRRQATIVGSARDDEITGTRGADVIMGVGGNDKLSGLAGKDVICGGQGEDRLNGGAGNDQLSGQSGNDRLFGRKGKDKLSGQAGDDTLKGGPGKDTLKGGPGQDTLSGGVGKDKQVQ